VTLSLAAVARENSASAEGRIRDADIASESANLIRKQISQQAAVNVLAQANQQPALALQLLR
jgi:flagellin